ncbi:MAG: GNAT family N-acetyltransferase [Candidatus Eisenbacteria bacterium]
MVRSRGRAIMSVRDYRQSDAEHLVEILRLNGQYEYPHIEGPDAMDRVAGCDAGVVFVADIDERVVGYIRAVYDGARALIHLLTVHPDYQGKGVGAALLAAVEEELKKRGASGTIVTVTEAGSSYWERMGFRRLPAFLMLKEFGPE